MAEALSLASGAKVNFLEAYSQTGELPISNEEAGYQSQSGKHVDNVTIGYTNDMSVAIKAQFNNSPETNKILHGETVMLVVREDKVGNSGVLSWLCYSTLESKYLPNGCSLWEG